MTDLLLADPRDRPAPWELNGALVATIDRMLVELDLATHARLRDARPDGVASRTISQAMDQLRTTIDQPGQITDRHLQRRPPGSSEGPDKPAERG